MIEWNHQFNCLIQFDELVIKISNHSSDVGTHIHIGDIFAVLAIRPKMDPFYFMFVFLSSIIIANLMSSTTGSNAGASMSSTTYPIPPHLGLDGVNLSNRQSRNYI